LNSHCPVTVASSRIQQENIERVQFSIKQKREKVVKALEKGDRTAFQIRCDVFPKIPPESLFRALSDAMGQLKLLEDERVVIRTRATPFVFRRAWTDAGVPGA
jgi:hypothetical protein